MKEFFVIISFIVGTFVGSFINVVLYRVPRHESIVFPPSHCPRCGTMLRPWDLIPVLSWLFYGGFCKYCGGKISFIYPLIELSEGFIFSVSTFIFWGNPFLILKGIVLLSFFLIITFLDIKYQIIPDGINLSIFIAGIVLVLVSWIGDFDPGYKPFLPNVFLDGLAAIVIGSGSLWLVGWIGELLFKRPAMGGGDIKLMAGLSLFVGYKYTVFSIFLAFMLGAILGLFLYFISFGKKSTYIPFGPYLAIAVVLFYFGGEEKILQLWEKIIGSLLF